MSTPEWDSTSPPADLGGFNQLIGVRLTAWTYGRARLAVEVDERHMNSLGIAHGGVGASLLDTAMGMGVSYRGPDEPRGWCVTLTLNTQFLHPMKPGLITAESQRVGGGRQTVFMEAEVRDDENRVLMTGQGTFKVINRPAA